MAFGTSKSFSARLPWTKAHTVYAHEKATSTARDKAEMEDNFTKFRLNRSITQHQIETEKRQQTLRLMAEQGSPRDQMRPYAAMLVEHRLMTARLVGMLHMVEQRGMKTKLTSEAAEFVRTEKVHTEFMAAIEREMAPHANASKSVARARLASHVDTMMGSLIQTRAEAAADVDDSEDNELTGMLDTAMGVDREGGEASMSVDDEIERMMDAASIQTTQTLPSALPHVIYAHAPTTREKSAPEVVTTAPPAPLPSVPTVTPNVSGAGKNTASASGDTAYDDLHKRFLRFRSTPSTRAFDKDAPPSDVGISADSEVPISSVGDTITPPPPVQRADTPPVESPPPPCDIPVHVLAPNKRVGPSAGDVLDARLKAVRGVYEGRGALFEPDAQQDTHVDVPVEKTWVTLSLQPDSDSDGE